VKREYCVAGYNSYEAMRKYNNSIMFVFRHLRMVLSDITSETVVIVAPSCERLSEQYTTHDMAKLGAQSGLGGFDIILREWQDPLTL
jgi:hypothetical protein